MKREEGAKGPAEGKLYYAQRGGGLAAPSLSFDEMRSLIAATYSGLETEGWFQEWFGYDCVDDHDANGKAGPNPNGFLHTRLWITNLWPLRESMKSADERTLFSVIELLFDCVSEPVDGRYHSFSGCGWHYNTFNGDGGQTRWRSDVNRILEFYGEGFELSSTGDVQRRGATGVRELMQQPLPSASPRSEREKVEAAIRAYRHFSATRPERITAIRHLADLLEFHRARVKESQLSADERELRNIANNFAIRHHHEKQKADYSDEFVDWLFHMFLSMVHLTLKLVHGAETNQPAAEEEYDEEDIPF